MHCALLLSDEARAAPPAQVDAFLRYQHRAYLFVETDGGEVRGWPLTAFYRSGLLYFTTYVKSVKVRHFDGAMTSAAIVATPEGETPVRFCEVRGAIRVVPFTPEVVERFLAFRAQESLDQNAETSEAMKARFRDRLTSGKRVLIEIDVEAAELGQVATGVAA